MKRAAIKALLLLIPLILLQESAELQDGADALLGAVDLSDWDAWFAAEAPDIPFRPSDFVHDLAGTEDPIKDQALPEQICSYALPSLKAACAKLILFIGLAVLAAVLNGIHGTISISKTAGMAFRFAAACTVLAAVIAELRSVQTVLNRVGTLSERLLPVLLGYLTLTGMEQTAGAVAALFTLLSDTVIRLLQTVIAPIACVGGVMLALDACTSGRLASIGKLLLRAAKWLLGLLCTGFGLLSALRGVAAASSDGLLIRTARFAAGSLPAVGGIVSDSVEVAFRLLFLVRNALSIGGAVLILLLCAKPVLSVFFTRCSLRAASAIAEPLSGKPYADLLRGLGDTLHVLLLSELGAIAMALLAVSPMLIGGVG